MQFHQGYLNRDRERTVRVRIASERSFLTIKGLTKGISRAEFEYPIHVEDAEPLLALCQGPLIEKARHVVVLNGTTWEVDEFFGDNAGLVVAEVKLESETQSFDGPDWLGTEVTDDSRYFKSNLAIHSYRSWSERTGP